MRRVCFDLASDRKVVTRSYSGAQMIDDEDRGHLFGRGQCFGALPAGVLRDLKLSKMDGLESLGGMRSAECTKLPPVVLTFTKEDWDVVNSYHRGCNSHVRKPVNFDGFSHAANQLGLYWLLLNGAPPG